MTVVPFSQIETVDDLIEMMAKEISPYAFGAQSSEAERCFARAAAQRALMIAGPILLQEVAVAIDHPDGRNAEAVAIIMGLRSLFD